ncbi:MAG: hypothetical protein HW421_2080 [Ignavibacteria bacterium]|nr:hypothetical protein [Ignavibacteria bacterium]
MKHENPYKESMRYIENARATLKLAGREDKYYQDVKYVQTACGTAYLGMLKALDYLFDIKKVPKRRGKKAIEYYQSELSKMDKKLLNHLNDAYHLLHLEGYYGGIKNIKVINEGFEIATLVINALKPYSNNGAE